MFLPRSAETRLASLMKGFPAVVVTGARHVGKSTLLRHALREAADVVVFDPVVDVENARRDPQLFLDNYRTRRVPRPRGLLARRVRRDGGRRALARGLDRLARIGRRHGRRARHLDTERRPEHPAWGPPLFETAVFAETRKAVSLMSPRPIVHHRQTSAGAKVDLLERDGTFFPIEVKAARRPSRGDTTGITAFRKTYAKLRVARGLVGAPCEAMTPLSENDWAMPWDAVVPSPAPFRHSSAQRFAPAAKRPSPRSGPGPEKG